MPPIFSVNSTSQNTINRNLLTKASAKYGVINRCYHETQNGWVLLLPKEEAQPVFQSMDLWSSNKFKVNNWYTVSFKARASGPTKVACDFNPDPAEEGGGFGGTFSQVFFDVDTKEKQFQVTGRLDFSGTSPSVMYFRMWRLAVDPREEILIKDIKIEEGKERTAYCSAPEDSPNRNLILNSNFFDDAYKWDNRNNPEIFEVVNVNGKNWLHIKGDAKPSLVDNSNVQGTTQNTTLIGGAHVTPGKRYTLSAKVRGGSANQHIYFNMRWGRKDHSHIRNTYVGFTPDAKETYIQYSEIAPDESYTITANISANTEQTYTTIGDNETNEFYVTDLKIEESNIATIWTPAPEDRQGENLILASAGGENYILNGGSAIRSYDSDGFGIITFNNNKSALTYNHILCTPSLLYSVVRNHNITISFYARTDYNEYKTSSDGRGMFVELYLMDDGNNYTRYPQWNDLTATKDIDRQWKLFTFTTSVYDAKFTNPGGVVINDKTRIGIDIFNHSLYKIQIKQVKVELGAFATPWTSSPADQLEKNLFIKKTSTIGYLMDNNSGNISPYNVNGETSSDYIPIIYRQPFTIQTWATSPGNVAGYYYMIDYQWFKDKTADSHIGDKKRTIGGNEGYTHGIVTTESAPTDAKYIRVSARLYKDGKMKVEYGAIPSAYSLAPEDTSIAKEAYIVGHGIFHH